MHALVLLMALAQAPEVESMKAFRGPEGQLVEVVRLQPRAAKKLLVRVKNADSEHDGLVVPCTLENEDASTTFRGGSWNLVALFARKEWPVLEKKYQAAAEAAAAKLSKPCGHAVAFTFDWSSFPDAVMGEADVWKVCEPAVAQAQKKCPVKVTCRLGAATGVTSEGDALVFTAALR